MVKKEIQKKYEGKKINGVDIIKCLYTDESGDTFVVAKCPEDGCCNFFKTRIRHINSGNTKSCGCKQRKHIVNLGKENKKPNPMYFPIGYNYGICYFNNVDDYFIFDVCDYEQIKKYTWSARKRKGNKKIDAYTKINGKTVYLTNYLMNTAVDDGYQCDHINQETRDNRDSFNLRNGTKEMNLLNTISAKGILGTIRKLENGKFEVYFPKYVSSKVYDTMSEAKAVLDEHNYFTYDNSQKIAEENETNQYAIDKYYFLGGVLEKIYSEKSVHICKIRLVNLVRDKENGLISEDEFNMELFKLVDFYKELKKENLQNECA